MWGGPASGFRAFSKKGHEFPSPRSPRPPQAQGKQRRPPDDAGNKRRHKTDTGVETTAASRVGAGMSTTVAAGNGKVAGHKRRQERNNRRRNGQHRQEQPLPQPGARVRPCAAGGGPRFCSNKHDAPRAFVPQKRDTPRARHKKRRSAKPKFCRTPDRHGSGLARSLNRTFSYRMKLVRMTGSFSGSGTPAALPASKQRSIHAMFLAS